MIVKHYSILEDELQSKPFEEGALYVTKDTNRIYFDLVGEVSHTLISADPIILSTESDRESILAPIPNKLYFVLESKSIYLHCSGEWYNTSLSYTHPNYTAKSSGLYKITVDDTGHVSDTTAVTKSDITALGIPAQDTTYSVATTSANGLMGSNDKIYLNSIRGSSSLTSVVGKTIADLQNFLDNWLSEYIGVANATTSFVANPYWITQWNSGSTTATIGDGVRWTVTVIGICGSKQYVQLRIASYSDGLIYYTYRSNGTWGTIRKNMFEGDVTLSTLGVTATATELNYVGGVTSAIQTQLDSKTNKRDGTPSYNNLASLYVGGTSPTYYRITIPSSTNSVYTMITMEVSMRQNYADETGGKILINAHHGTGGAVWIPINATVLGTLSSTIKVYASDNYFYIAGGAAWGTISVDKIIAGDTASHHDLSNTTVDIVTSLPSTYYAATMYYGLHSGNYTSHISPSAIGALALTGGTLNGNLVLAADKHYYMTYGGTAYQIIKTHSNASISINAASGNLYLGYQNTQNIFLGANGNWGKVTSSGIYGAVWNDYAEYRNQSEDIEPGYCVASNDDGIVYKTIERLQSCDGIVSDTFGFAIGETDDCKTPLAVAGRVLAYCEGNRNDYHSGDVVCAGSDGRVCKMTREEIKEYPDRIVGVVSEIPKYEIWGSGNVKVNNRIWIKVK